MRYEWQPAPTVNEETVKGLSTTLGVTPFLARLLRQRGISDQAQYDAFMHPDLDRLHDPFLLHDMRLATERIFAAVAAGEKITIYGDYDVDGLTSTAIMAETLESLGAEPEVFIPDRFTDGYGPNADVYHYLAKTGTQLLITVDNGASGASVIDEAMADGMDVIVTDHHELPDILPQAVAVVHPRHPAGNYPFGDLSGAGVAFKVATALLGEVPMDSIDLAALGTIADLVSLTDENRILAQIGLKLIQTQPRIGISAILSAADVKPSDVTETTVGFVIGPRLNALGRLGDATPGVKILTTFDEEEAATIAQQIEQLNQTRQGLVQEIVQQALAIAQNPDNRSQHTLLIAHEGWHEGVLGIVASRVVEATGKPTIVMTIDPESQTAKGSGRSIQAYHLFNALAPIKSQLIHFGGHHMAIGLTADVAQLPAIHQQMEVAARQVATTTLPPLVLSGRLDPEDLNLTNYSDMRQLAPFGPGNLEPVFTYLPQQISDVKAIGKTGDHIRARVDDHALIGFGFGDQANALMAAQQVKLAVLLGQNEWQGRTSFQLQLKDMQIQQPDVVDWRMPTVDQALLRQTKTYIFFSDKVKQKFEQRYIFGGPTRLANTIQQPVEDAVLVDLPPDQVALADLMQRIALPVSVMFYQAPSELVAIPTRQEFGQVLHFLRTHPGFDKHHLAKVAKEVHLTVHQVILAVQVFFELHFVTIDGAFISVVAQPVKRPLTDSTALIQRQRFLALGQQLQTAPRKDIERFLLGLKQTVRDQDDNQL